LNGTPPKQTGNGEKHYRIVLERDTVLSADDVHFGFSKTAKSIALALPSPIDESARICQRELLSLEKKRVHFRARHDQRPSTKNNTTEDDQN
jgi:hypothetical protein